MRHRQPVHRLHGCILIEMRNEARGLGVRSEFARLQAEAAIEGFLSRTVPASSMRRSCRHVRCREHHSRAQVTPGAMSYTAGQPANPFLYGPNLPLTRKRNLPGFANFGAAVAAACESDNVCLDSAVRPNA